MSRLERVTQTPSGITEMPLQSLRASTAVRNGRSDTGQDLLEYALLVSLIVLTVLGAVDMLGSTVKTALWDVIAAARP